MMRHLIFNHARRGPGRHPSDKRTKQIASLLSLLTILLLSLSPLASAASAQDEAATNRAANKLFDEGDALFKEGSAASLRQAIEKYKNALSLYRSAQNRSDEAVTLSNIGLIYSLLGEWQTALAYYNQALPPTRAVGDRRGEATTLNNIGRVYDDLGERQKALDYFDQALSLIRAVGDRSVEAATLGNIAGVYAALGERQKALDYYNQGLSLRRAMGDRAGEATALGNIGQVYADLGEKQKALDYHNQALLHRRATGDRASEANSLNNIGAIHLGLGETQKALDYFNQALPLIRAAGDPVHEATVLNNIGAAYSDLGETQKALDYYNRALPLKGAVGDRGGEASTLGNIGELYAALGETQKALAYYGRALPLFRAVGDREGEATALNNVGVAYSYLGQRQKALDYLNQALPLFRAVGGREGEAITLHHLMIEWAESNHALAVFYGKQAVNAYQQLRANIRGLDKSLQQSYLRSKEETYRALADLLISKGRLPEAQRVLDMLKEEEFFGFVRRNPAAAALATARIEFTPAEADLEARFNKVINDLAAVSAKRSALLAKQSLTREEEALVRKYEDEMTAANEGFQKFVAQLQAEQTAARLGKEAISNISTVQGLQDTLRDFNAVALYTVVGKDHYRAILVLPDAQKAYEYAIKDTDLNQKVFAFRQVLQRPDRDPRPRAQELYRILIGPELARDLRQSGAQTVLWSLDGVLRYLPVAALHDGQSYVVEGHRNVIFTPANRDRLRDAVSQQWQALGLGVSKPHSLKLAPDTQLTFSALPGVREELSGIVRDATAQAKGVLAGQVLLDEAFTKEAMRDALRLRGNAQSYKLVHIASHFNFQPGDEAKSFLLLGDGTALTLQQLGSLQNLFSKVELLTLSACDTATGGADAAGKEVEGFAVMAQNQGASAIIASLWPVSDPSTSALMQEFYRLRGGGGLPKAEALRRAQLALLRGGTKVAAGAAVKRADVVGTSAAREAAPAFTPDPRAPFAHPYYWAPFILIGNWR
jgi:CHAT domain-containing protein/tetratricopeptide (TPR) repeat protein